MDQSRVEQLVRAIEGKDMSTAAHTWRVVLYSRAMGEAAGIGRERMRELTHAAALHDVGKLDIPREILAKPARLSPSEFEVIKQHPVTGFARMVTLDVEDPLVLDLIRYHHERWDGRGYPYGYAGEEIPFAARYFAVIDAFDAMTSVRPYRHEVGEDAARRAIVEIKSGAGTRYAPEAVEMFTGLFETGRLDWILHYFNDDCAVPEFGDAEAADKAFRARKRP
ncbi:MAG TPA: HD domain-containing phosphohydrolase [Phycisphaerales bacterium]|nr:HD domain-containing phosphohydrolase [Phycisphaerales bacterium]